MLEDWLTDTMYATKRRRRTVKSVKTPAKDPPKSNPSKRHRERLNGELDHLASLLPFEQSVISKLDKLSILRLAVSYLRTKSFFQNVLPARYGIESHLMARAHLFHDPGFSEGESILQALYGFLFVVTCDGEVFFASRTVEQYLGFHQSDIIHQSVMELIHSEDREEFRRQLTWSSVLPPDKAGMPLHEVMLPENIHHLHRSFTVRFRCLLDNTSGFITLEINGWIRVLHGQCPRGEEPQLALFATCSPFGPLSLFDIPSREMTFKTKHKMDFSPVTMDSRGKIMFAYTDQELSGKSGYDLIHPDDLNYFSSAHQELIKTGSSGLIAYRWQTKHLQWMWLQSSCKVIYKNSKPDFIICTHRQLTEDEGQDLYGKRGNEFKLPYPLLDVDLCTGFNFGDDELNAKSKSSKSKKKSSNSNTTSTNSSSAAAVASVNGYSGSSKDCNGQTSSKKRKPGCLINGITSYSSYPTSFPGYDRVGAEYKAPDILYPYASNNFGFDTDLYRTQTYGAFPSTMYPSTDPYRLDVDKHGLSNGYFIDHRQYQHPTIPYGNNGYSDFMGTSKYGYEMPNYGIDTYSLDLSKRMDCGDLTQLGTDTRRYATDFHHHPHNPHTLNAQAQPHPHDRYAPTRLGGTALDAVDLRSSTSLFGPNSFINSIEGAVAPPCMAPSLFKPVSTPNHLAMATKDQQSPSKSGLCSGLVPLSPSGNQELIPPLPLPSLHHNSVIKSTGQPDSVLQHTDHMPTASPQHQQHHHNQQHHHHQQQQQQQVSVSHTDVTMTSINDVSHYTSPEKTQWSHCLKTSTPTNVMTSQSLHNLDSCGAGVPHESSVIKTNGLDPHSKTPGSDRGSSPGGYGTRQSPASQDPHSRDKENSITGIPVSVVKPPSWLHGYNNNSSNNNNNNNHSSNNHTNLGNIPMSVNGVGDQMPLTNEITAADARGWMDHQDDLSLSKTHRLFYPESCHSVKHLGLKAFDKGDNPLLSFSEMTHTLMSTTH